MSEPTREERIEKAWQAGQADYLGKWDQSTLRVALEAAGLDSLLAERDRLREAARKVATTFTALAEDWNDGEFAWCSQDDLINAIVALRVVLGEPGPEDGNDG